jgi:hypothetical protein
MHGCSDCDNAVDRNRKASDDIWDRPGWLKRLANDPPQAASRGEIKVLAREILKLQKRISKLEKQYKENP